MEYLILKTYIKNNEWIIDIDGVFFNKKEYLSFILEVLGEENFLLCSTSTFVGTDVVEENSKFFGEVKTKGESFYFQREIKKEKFNLLKSIFEREQKIEINLDKFKNSLKKNNLKEFFIEVERNSSFYKLLKVNKKIICISLEDGFSLYKGDKLKKGKLVFKRDSFKEGYEEFLKWSR